MKEHKHCWHPYEPVEAIKFCCRAKCKDVLYCEEGVELEEKTHGLLYRRPLALLARRPAPAPTVWTPTEARGCEGPSLTDRP